MAKKARQGLLPGMEEMENDELESKRSSATKKASKKASDRKVAIKKADPPDFKSVTTAARKQEVSAEEGLKGKTVYLVDAPAMIYRSFHAIRGMSNPKGEPTNALYGFVRDIFMLITDKNPDYLVCVFDAEGPTFRNEIYPEYKANREEMPVDLRSQMVAIREWLKAMNIAQLELSNYEADDILATLGVQAEAEQATCYLVTSDKDCRQLITDRVKIFDARKNLIYDKDALLKDWGIRPDQAVDFQALMGDSVDNVPGVPMIGPKAAQQLLGEYETLDNVLDNADNVKGAKKQENLKKYREQALLSKRLVLLDTTVPIEFDWKDGIIGTPDFETVIEMFDRYDFRRFKAEFEAEFDNQKPADVWESKYHTVATEKEFQSFLKQLKRQKQFCFDTETTSLTARQAEVVGYAIAWEEGEAFYLPVKTPDGEPALDPQVALAGLKPILEDPNIQVIGQNLKYDMVVMKNVGVQIRGVAFDTMIAAYLLDAGERSHGLDQLAKSYLNYETTKISELIGTGKNQKRMDEVPVVQITEYAAEDAEVPLRLLPILKEKLKSEELLELMLDLELPLIDVLVEMEFNGIKVDRERLQQLSDEFGVELDRLEADIYKLAGREFKINSPKQLQEILFDELKLPVVKKGRTGPSTDVSVLEELASKHELPAKIIEYRQFAKLKNTYVDALPDMIHPTTGRVHASFNQHIAATGRLSSSDPNLQNIPIRTDRGREIRSAFTAGEPGWQLVAADYSQIELRVLAHFCQDEALCEAFEKDQDIHATVASQVNDVPLEEVTSEMRRQAKAVNFGIIYGQSAFGLAQNLGIDKADAEIFIDNYFARYARVEEFLTKTLADAAQNGYVKTILGRKRKIEGIRPDRNKQLNLPERTAINTVIQGSAADLIKKAMLAIHQEISNHAWESRLLLQIHDELVFEVSSQQMDQLVTMVIENMISVIPLSVPLKVDVAAGPNWFDVKPLHSK